jgi:hypothetical protein
MDDTTASRPNADDRLRTLESENSRLVAELEEAEAYEQHLRQLIVDVKGELAAGNHAKALSMLNAALSEIDCATDVVVRHH